jgi:hypothetical protein
MQRDDSSLLAAPPNNEQAQIDMEIVFGRAGLLRQEARALIEATEVNCWCALQECRYTDYLLQARKQSFGVQRKPSFCVQQMVPLPGITFECVA